MTKLTILTLFFLAACGHQLSDKEWKEIQARRKHPHGFAKYIYSENMDTVTGVVLGDSFDTVNMIAVNGDTIILAAPIIMSHEEHIQNKINDSTLYIN